MRCNDSSTCSSHSCISRMNKKNYVAAKKLKNHPPLQKYNENPAAAQPPIEYTNFRPKQHIHSYFHMYAYDDKLCTLNR